MSIAVIASPSKLNPRAPISRLRGPMARPGVPSTSAHRVLGLGLRAEHPEGDRPQTDSLLLEPGRQPLVPVHQVHSPLNRQRARM
jgi:hypothetical protein